MLSHTHPHTHPPQASPPPPQLRQAGPGLSRGVAVPGGGSAVAPRLSAGPAAGREATAGSLPPSPCGGCAGVCGVSGSERCCVILSTPRSGSSHETDTFCLLCFGSIGRRSGYCCRKLLLFLCSVDQLFFPAVSCRNSVGASLFLSLSLSLSPSGSLSLMHAVCLSGNPRRRLITAAPSNTNSWDSSVAFADVY